MQPARPLTPLTEQSDAELVAGARMGSEPSSAALFRRHQGALRRLAFRCLGADSDADDLVQDTFVSALANLHQLENGQAFASWISGILVRLVGKHLRRRRLLERLGLRRSEPIDIESFLSSSCPPNVAVELRAVYRILQELPVEGQLALVLRRIEGLSIEETAAYMGLSMATVKRRLVDADERLRRSSEGTKR
jgi:RNA polymerase sigma-70 factor (ECF subfamily)